MCLLLCRCLEARRVDSARQVSLRCRGSPVQGQQSHPLMTVCKSLSSIFSDPEDAWEELQDDARDDLGHHHLRKDIRPLGKLAGATSFFAHP